MIQDKISAILQFYVGDMNDDVTRNSIIKKLIELNIRGFCNEINNTSDIIDENKLIILYQNEDGNWWDAVLQPKINTSKLFDFEIKHVQVAIDEKYNT